MTAGPEADAGVATVWTALSVVVLLTLVVVGVDVGSAVTGRHRAEAAADLAALAAAGAAAQGTEPACTRARGVAIAMEATVTHCVLTGWDALVEVSTTRGVSVIGSPAAVGRAHAGPADVASTAVHPAADSGEGAGSPPVPHPDPPDRTPGGGAVPPVGHRPSDR